MSKPFFPRNKPKSWVVMISAGLLSLLVFGPIGFLGAAVDFVPLYVLGVAGFLVCCATFAVMWFVFGATTVLALSGGVSVGLVVFCLRPAVATQAATENATLQSRKTAPPGTCSILYFGRKAGLITLLLHVLKSH